MLYIGIDVAKATLQVCVLSEPKAQQRQFENTRKGIKALVKWLKSFRSEVWVTLEATGTYGDEVSGWLHREGHRVSVVNPARIKAYAESQLTRHKTDALDAQVIADFCRTQQPPLWTPPSAAERELRALVRHLDDLKALRQAEKNRLEAKPDSVAVVRQIEQLIVVLDNQIADTIQRIRDHIDRHPDLKAQHDLLTSIPGLGDLTSFHLLAELGDLRRFTDVRQVVALVGLNPQQRQSGRSVHYTAGIARMGHSDLRAALYMPAIVAKHHNPVLKVFAERLANNGLKKKEVIVAVMRKLLHLAYGVIKSGRPFDLNYAQGETILVATP
jgi:transposase